MKDGICRDCNKEKLKKTNEAFVCENCGEKQASKRWKDVFYGVYNEAESYELADINVAAKSVAYCIDEVFELIKSDIRDKTECKKAYTEVSEKVIKIAVELYNDSKMYYDGFDIKDRDNHMQEWLENVFSAITCVYNLGDSLEYFFSSDSEANRLSVNSWKQGIKWHQMLIDKFGLNEGNLITIKNYSSKIKKYNRTYTVSSETEGCYIATCVYGSYDCPQVRVLRKYRDSELAGNRYGRAFIKIYYAISPALVKWFGRTTWFKKFWKGKLDKMVAKLYIKGY